METVTVTIFDAPDPAAFEAVAQKVWLALVREVVLKDIVELLAAILRVVYGLWGIFSETRRVLHVTPDPDRPAPSGDLIEMSL